MGEPWVPRSAGWAGPGVAPRGPRAAVRLGLRVRRHFFSRAAVSPAAARGRPRLPDSQASAGGRAPGGRMAAALQF